MAENKCKKLTFVDFVNGDLTDMYTKKVQNLVVLQMNELKKKEGNNKEVVGDSHYSPDILASLLSSGQSPE